MTKRFTTFLSAVVLAETVVCGLAGSAPEADAAKTQQSLSSVCKAQQLVNDQWQPVPASLQRPACMKHP